MTKTTDGLNSLNHMGYPLDGHVRYVLTPAGARHYAYLIQENAQRPGGMGSALRNHYEGLRRVANTGTGRTEPAEGDEGPSSTHADEISTSDAAQKLGVSREWVNYLGRTGQLGESRKVRGRRMVSRVEVEALEALRAARAEQ